MMNISNERVFHGELTDANLKFKNLPQLQYIPLKILGDLNTKMVSKVEVIEKILS